MFVAIEGIEMAKAGVEGGSRTLVPGFFKPLFYR